MTAMTMPAMSVPASRMSDAISPRTRLIDKDAPARISPDRAAFVTPIAIGLVVVFAIAGGTSGFAFTDLISVRTGYAFLGLAAFVVVEVAMVILTFAAAIYRERGANGFLVLGAWAIALLLTLISMCVNLLHGVEMTKALSATDPIDVATAWLTSGVLTLPPLLALTCAHAFVLIFVRHAEGTRKQRSRAAARREAAAVAVDEPVVAAPVGATPRAVSNTIVRTVNRPEIQSRMASLYAEGMNDSQIKNALRDEFGVGRNIFEAHRDAAKAEAGIS